MTHEFLFRGIFRSSEPLATPVRTVERPTKPRAYERLITTMQWSPQSATVDKSNWQPCHACGVLIPVCFDCRLTPSNTLEPTGTITYVCPHCCATQMGAERWHDPYNTPQTQCHVCAQPLGDSLACPNCGMLQYWTVVGCTTCGARQAVSVPHLTDGCDVYTLQCVACEALYYSLCIC